MKLGQNYETIFPWTNRNCTVSYVSYRRAAKFTDMLHGYIAWKINRPHIYVCTKHTKTSNLGKHRSYRR